MKIKLGFVTNSSSTCFLIGIKDKKQIDLYNYFVVDGRVFERDIQDFDEIGTVKDLEIYHKGEPFDWVEKAVGYKGYGNLYDEWFDQAKEIILNGGTALLIRVERNQGSDTALEKAVKAHKDLILLDMVGE
jgi:hypothetical protein